MNLYDIHTHDSIIPENDDDTVPRYRLYHILNTYPLGFEYAKDSKICSAFSCGVHPWYSEDAQPQISFLKEIAVDDRIVAIGETGLDRLKGPDINIQENIFIQQIELSEYLKKPLIIHCVKAWDELLHLKKSIKPSQRWIIHGYRGKPELTKQLLAHYFYFSIGERFNSDSLQIIPKDRLFCETDESDIALTKIYENIADTLDLSIEELALIIEKNIFETFNFESKESIEQKDLVVL